MVSDEKSFGERFKAVRKKIDLSQKEFAYKLNYKDYTSIGKIEKNLTFPTLTTLKTLIEEYKINLNWLITGKGEMIINAELTFKNVLDPSDKIKINEFFINRNIKLCDKVHELHGELVKCQKEIIRLQQECIDKNEKNNK